MGNTLKKLCDCKKPEGPSVFTFPKRKKPVSIEIEFIGIMTADEKVM